MVTIAIFFGLAIWAILLIHFRLVICYWEPCLLATTTLKSVGPELAGIVISVVTIDYLNKRRQDEQLKKQLILQMGSRHNDVTDTAIRALKSYGWLFDGSLKGARLEGANLQGVRLDDANLERALLFAANLGEAKLIRANLKKAHLVKAI